MQPQHFWLTRRLRNTAGSLIGFLALFLYAPALSIAQDRSAPEKIRLTYAATNLGFLHMFVAKDRGFYAAQGLEVELIRINPAASIAAMLSGDAGYTQLFGSAVRAAAKGAPIRAISMSVGAPFFSLAARPQFTNVKELKGKSVGVSAIGGSNYISARMLLQHYGVDPDREVQLVAIGDHSSLYQALKIGRVDAVTINPPYSVLLELEGFSLLAAAPQVVSFPFTGVGTTVRKINENRNQVKKLLKAEILALRYIRRQPQATIDFISKKFAIDPSIAAASYHLVIDAFSIDGKVSVPGVERLLDLERKDGSISKSITIDQVVDFSLTEEALRESANAQ